MSAYRPKTGAKCECRQGVERDNCPRCEGTGMVIDFKAIREKPQQPAEGAQFTPGPWHVEKCSAPVYGSDGTLMVNGVGIGAGSRHIGTISSKNAHNDANLIAAAPAMYEALQAAQAFLLDGTPDNEISDLERHTLQQIESALAQAEGR